MANDSDRGVGYSGSGGRKSEPGGYGDDEGGGDEDERILSFYYLDEVMEEYPESRLFYVALARQY